jgi:hypothetical protein
VSLGENLEDPDLVESETMRLAIPGDPPFPGLHDPVAEPKPAVEVAGVHDH